MKPVKKLRGVVLLSSGIDSPVAAYLMLKKGAGLVAVHFDNRPLTIKVSLKKAKELAKHLSMLTKKKLRLYIISNSMNQEEIVKNCKRKYVCVICKRLMFRIAENVARKEKCGFLVTGENLGQVASQTLANLAVISQSTNMTILRPLLCFDKNETISLAREIGTYQISSKAEPPCPAVPRHPATKAGIKEVESEEKKLNLKGLVKDSVKKAKILNF